MEKRICIGKIVKLIGIKGEVKVITYTDDNKRFTLLKNFYLQNCNESFECEKASIRNDFVVLKIKGIDTPEQAEKLKEKLIYVDRDNAVKLKQDSYFICDLIGCEIINLSGEKIGTVTDVENFGASDIIVFKTVDNIEMRAPFIQGVFAEINIDKKSLVAQDRFFEVIV